MKFELSLAWFGAHGIVLLFFLSLLSPVALLASERVPKRAALKSTVSMREAVLFALKANPTLGAQAASSRAATAGRKAARGAFGPKLGIVYTAMKQERESEPTPTKTPELGSYSLGFEVSQPVFQGFRLLAAYQKAALEEESNALALKNSRLQVIESVQTSFISLLRSQENCKSQREALDRLRDQLEITRGYYLAGLKPKLDVLQAEVDFREAERLLLQIEHSRDTESARLNTLLGLSANAHLTYKGTLGYVPFADSLETCLERAYRNRPDLRMAALSVAIAGKDQKSVQAGYYPHIEAYYNMTNAGNTPLLKREGENGSRYTSWEVGARATWDVFQFGTTYYADKQAGELVTRMRYEENELRLKVGYDLKTKYLALREAKKRISAAKASVASADEAYRAALARYREQVGTGFDVLDTSSKLTTARFSLSSAYADYLTALAQLYTAMGEEHPGILYE
ncbi:MAG: TolC family protein [Desulfovibrionaceae bacterium]|nr:TolC family protein [Desulfovibrionaceae bacterium]